MHARRVGHHFGRPSGTSTEDARDLRVLEDLTAELLDDVGETAYESRGMDARAVRRERCTKGVRHACAFVRFFGSQPLKVLWFVTEFARRLDLLAQSRRLKRAACERQGAAAHVVGVDTVFFECVAECDDASPQLGA